MKVLLFGATGMVGQGVLRECLRDPVIDELVSIGRSPAPSAHAKLRSVIHRDLTDLASLDADISGADACFFCLGVSSAGMSESRYSRLTYDLTMAVAYTLVRLNPGMVFIYVSGMGADGSETGATMWARVKGRTENALLKLPLRTFIFRPGLIRPLHGVRSRTTLYRILNTLHGTLLSPLQRWLPGSLTTTEQIGKAMIRVARGGYETRILETADINGL